MDVWADLTTYGRDDSGCLGTDKPDVRVVIHCGMPKTVEAYYQQTGRAGRDGLPAKCILLFSRADGVRQRRRVGPEQVLFIFILH